MEAPVSIAIFNLEELRKDWKGLKKRKCASKKKKRKTITQKKEQRIKKKRSKKKKDNVLCVWHEGAGYHSTLSSSRLEKAEPVRNKKNTKKKQTLHD